VFFISPTSQHDGNVVTGEQLGELYQTLAADFPIVTIEDPFDEDDWANWSKYVYFFRVWSCSW
jgi:enolase